MPAPTNISAATAIDVGSLPASITQNVNNAGTTYTVWYKYTAVAGNNMIGIWAFGGAVPAPPAYNANLIVYGPNSSVTVWLINQTENAAAQFPVVPGSLYYFKISSRFGNVTPAVLTLQVQAFTDTTAPVGSLLINDDTAGGYPLVIISSTTGLPLKFVQNIPAGENGGILANGTMLFEEIDSGFLGIALKMYDSNFNLLFNITTPYTQPMSTNKVDKFYVGDNGSQPTATVKTVLLTGAFGSTWVLPATGLSAMAPSNDETILYYAGGSPTLGGAVKRWDLIGNAALSDLAVGVASHYICHDMLVMADGSIIVAFQKASATKALLVNRYDAAGSILGTYTYGSDHNGITARLAIDTNPLLFWLWVHTAAPNSKSRFVKITASTMAAASTFDSIVFEAGIDAQAATVTPERYGHSSSCPMLVSTLLIGLNYSGIYEMIPDKTDDTLYTSDSTTVDVKIPNPMAQLYLSNDGS